MPRVNTRRFFSVALAMALSGLMGSAAASEDLSEEEVVVRTIENVRSSVVRVQTEGVRFDPATRIVEEVRTGGSGFAVAPGLVLTNYHVIEHAQRVEVSIAEGSTVDARLVGTAPEFDLALLQVAFTADRLPPLPLGRSTEVRVGQTVLAISHPFGLQSSVSKGIVSGIGRDLAGLEVGPSVIQFDAGINPGQSGGPLVNLQGEVVGVTTAKMRGAEAIGFAVPTEIVGRVIPDLQHMGHPFRPDLGFEGVSVHPDLARLLGLPVQWGVMVQDVTPGGVAEDLGLSKGRRYLELRGRRFMLGGDIIVGFDDQVVETVFDLDQQLVGARPGQSVVLSVVGPGGQRRIEFVVPEMRH
ncbi:MAG: S1C family serine protease [Thermoanaerobaculales bacterium]